MTEQTYSLTIGQCYDGHLTGQRVLELVELADPTERVTVRDDSGHECRVVADLDMECLVLRRGDDILAIGESVSEETLDRWCE